MQTPDYTSCTPLFLFSVGRDAGNVGLKSIFLRSGDSWEALTVVSAILALVPDLPQELRDRGLIYRDLGHAPAALGDLRKFTRLSPDAEEIAAIASMIESLETERVRLH